MLGSDQQASLHADETIWPKKYVQWPGHCEILLVHQGFYPDVADYHDGALLQ